MNPNDPIRVIPDSDQIRIVVAGGPGGFMGILRHGSPITATIPGGRGGEPKHAMATQKVDLPANWDKLVKKYKNIVPKYSMY